jgi:hypothetical protein
LVTSEPRARAVDFTTDALVLKLEDGRSVSVPLDWLPRLKNASQEERRGWELIDGGEEIRWEALDEDLSVPVLLGIPH